MTHDDVWHALPFFVNGTLRGKNRADVDTHLADCAECRSELAMQARVRDAIVHEDVRQESAQSSFDELWDRIADNDAALGAHANGTAHAGIATGAGTLIPAPAVASSGRVPAGGMLKWLVAAVIVEGIGLVALGAMTWNGNSGPGGPADYRTLSSPASALPGGQIRAVFAPELALRDLQGLLSTSKLSIVGGPTEAGVYTLALDDEQGSVDAALAGLRQSASVRFAEPIDKSQTLAR